MPREIRLDAWRATFGASIWLCEKAPKRPPRPTRGSARRAKSRTRPARFELATSRSGGRFERPLRHLEMLALRANRGFPDPGVIPRDTLRHPFWQWDRATATYAGVERRGATR